MPPDKAPVLSVEEAFKDDEIRCLICGKGGMKTLARHLNFMHNLKPGQYRKLFGLKADTLLTSKNYSEMRRQFAEEKVPREAIAKAREVRSAKCRGLIPTEPAEGQATDKRQYKRRHIFIPDPD